MKTVWTNGSFDVLHYGHFQLLQYAKSLGNILCVGIDTDRRISEKKGESRPIHNLDQRKSNLKAIRFVDYVFSFDSDENLENIIEDVYPDIIVVGDEYKDKKVIGSEFAKELLFFEMPRVTSSTEIINEWNRK